MLDVFTAVIGRWDHWQCCVKYSGVVRDDLIHNVNSPLLYFLFYMTLQLTLTVKREQKLKGSVNKSTEVSI